MSETVQTPTLVRPEPVPGGSALATTALSTPVLHVCTTCRAGTVPVDGVTLPGRALHDRLFAMQSDDMRVVGVECLSICAEGCGAAISMPGKWSYLMGRLAPEKAADIATFAGAYRRSKTGTVMPSRRPASLADMVIGRIPSLPASGTEQAA